MEDLRVIVQRMIDAGETEDNIKVVIERYKSKRQQDIQDPFATLSSDIFNEEDEIGASQLKSRFPDFEFKEQLFSFKNKGGFSGVKVVAPSGKELELEFNMDFQFASENELNNRVKGIQEQIDLIPTNYRTGIPLAEEDVEKYNILQSKKQELNDAVEKQKNLPEAQLKELKDFVESNKTDETYELFTKNRVKNIRLLNDFRKATDLDDVDEADVQANYPDISIFEPEQKLITSTAARTGMDIKYQPSYKQKEYETIQPYEDVLNEAFTELTNSDNPDLAQDETAVKELALEILRDRNKKEIKDSKAKELLEKTNIGDLPPSISQHFDENTDAESLKARLTVGSQEYLKDYALISEKLYNKESELIESSSDLQNLADKIEDPNYNFKVQEGEETVTLENGNIMPAVLYQEYVNASTAYNKEFKEYTDLNEQRMDYASNVKDISLQMDLFNKNYNDLLKFTNIVGTRTADVLFNVSMVNVPFMDQEKQEKIIKQHQEIKKITESSRNVYKPNVDFKTVDNFGDAVEWAAHSLLATNIPTLAAFATPIGVPTIFNNSLGEYYSDKSIEEYNNRDAAEEMGQDYKMKSSVGKLAVAIPYALSEVVLDKITTGARVTGLKSMLNSSKRSVEAKKSLLDYTVKASLNTSVDAIAGGVSEGGTEIIQNILTGRPISENLAEAFVGGILLDGSLSAMPAMKGIVYNQLSDYDTYSNVRDLTASINQYATLAETATTALAKQRYESKIKELTTKRDAEVATIESKIIGANGNVGLSSSDSKIFFSLRSKQEQLRTEFESISKDNNIPKKEKQKLLNEIKAEFNGIEGLAQNFLKSNFENKRQWDMLAVDNPTLVNEYKDKAKKILNTKGDDADVETISEKARILYNTDLIEKNLAAAKKNRKLDRNLTVIRNEEDFNKLIESLEQENISKERIQELKDGYKKGNVNGFNLSGVTEKGGSVIFVEAMASNNRTEVRTHELFHELGFQAFENDPMVFAGMADAILAWSKNNDKFLYNRLLNISETETGVGRGEGRYKADEVIAVFFEEVAANRVDLGKSKNKGLLAISGFGFAKTMKDNFGINFDLAGRDDTMELLVGLAKKVNAGLVTVKDIKALSTNEQIKALEKRGRKTYKNFADQKGAEIKKSYQKTERDKRIDAIGEQSTKTEWDAGGADMAISDMYMSGDLEAIVRNNLSSDLKNLPNYSEEDFISETIGELMPHIKNFNIDKKETQKGFGLSGWIRGQISNKIGNVLKKKKATTETFTVDTTDEKVKETVEAVDALEDLQEEDLSIAAQAKKKAKTERREEKGMEADVEYSTFRRALKVKGKQGLSDNIVNDVKKAVVKTMATERTTPDSDKFIANIKKSFLTELKKPIQDMMGKKDDFTDFLKTNREAIIAALPTSTLVQMERNVNPEDRTFTVEIKRNLSPTETDDAIANDQLPKDTNRNSGPTLYAKRMPSEGEFLRYFNPPLYVPSKKDPNKFVRSGLKGTRKDTLAEQMGIELAFDATMEVVQSPEVAERRSLVTNTDFLETGLDQLARSIGRGIDIKFSRSNPVEIEFKMDLALDNVNTDAYLDIRFSKSSRDAYIKRLVKNRPDLKGKEEQYVDSVFDWLETTNIKKRSKYEKMAMHYMAKGYLILPEDGYKVIEAERLAAIKKIDPFSVGNPNEIIEKYAGTVKGARTNPDTVKEFSNKKDLGNGIVTYDVEQTKEGQLAVREVIDTHFGKKSNPWCLASRDNRLEQAYAEFNNKEQANIKARELESQGYDVEVALIDGTYEVYGDLIAKPGNDMELNAAFTMWEKYQEGGKGYQVVFTNGKLSHFKDGSGKYWDKMDEPSNYISKKLSDLKLKDGFTQERYLNVNTGEQVLGDKSRVTGNRQDGTYTETTIKSTPTFGETVEIEEVRKNGELTYQKKLTTNNDESYGTETKYYKDSKTVTNTKSHPKGLKKGGSPLWALETTLDRAGKIAGVDLKLDKYTETSLVNDYKGTTTGSYNRVGSKHTVKGELNGKNATVEIFQSVGVNEDTNIAKVKVNGKTVYTAPKVDDTGIKFSRHRVEQASYRLKRKGVSSLDLNNPDDSLAFFLYAKRKKEEYENVYTIPDVAKVLDEDIKDSKGTQLSNALKLELVSLRNFVNAVKLHKDGPIQVVLEDVVADKTPDNLISVFEENVGIEDKADTFRTPARTFFWVKNKTNDNYKVLINKPENLASQSPRKLDKLRKMMEAKLKAQDQIKVIESVIGRKWNGTEDKLTVEEHDALINDSRFDLAYVQVQAKTDFAVHDYLKMGKKKPIASSYINVGTAGAMTMGNADPLELGSIIPRFEGRPMALVMRQIFEKSENGKKYSIKFKVEGQMRVNDKRKNGKPVFVKSRINFYIQEDVSRVVNEFNNRRGILKDATSYRDATPKEVEKLANFKFSKSKDKPNIKEIVASSKINEMIERSKGIPAQEIISGAGARRSGKNKNPFQFFVPPSADDLSGLLYYLAGKGKQGEADLKFMKQFLLDPLGKGERSLATKKQQIITDYKELKKELTDTHKKLKTLIPDSKYTYDTAVRVFLWNQEGYDIPDISDKEVGVLIDIVRNDAELQEYAQKLASIGSNYEGKYPEPIEDWIVGSTAKDLYDVTTKVGRKLFLSEFSENSNAFFTKDNINKLTAAYGVEYTEALEDMLYRIKTGENRPKSISEGDRNTKRFMNWVTNSTGAIMFFNSRSAVLQTLSTVNYLNWSDNNPLLAGKAFANQKQFWTDFAMIFNSDMLKQRRSGLSTDIQAAEIASAAATAKNKANAAIAYLLKKGFLPTQMADSFAISAGGAAFYRNRVNSYVKQGMDQKAAEEKAFADFADITEENQQSSRPDRVSQQQASPLGRLILAFQNTPMQYNRIIKKAMLDLQSGRGDTKTNVSKIIYYAGAQAFVFASLQNALFAMLFDDEDEDKSREEILKETEKEQLKLTRVINSMIDGLLNGSGVKGRVMSTIKNTILKFIEEDSKEWNANYTELAVEAAQLSPPIGSKLRKIAKAGENYGWNKKVIKEIGYDNYFNPAYVTAATFAEAATNVPLARVVRKLDNLVDAADQNNRAWQRVGLLMGWSQWDMGIEGKRRQVATEAKEEIKKKKKEKKKEERKAKEKRCSAIKSNGKRCKNITTNKSGRCYAHD